jgi:hypothetical protein
MMVEMKKPVDYPRPSYTVDYIPGNTRSGVFLGSPAFDASIKLNVVLGAEAWAAKRRLKIVDSLVARNIMPTVERVEAYVPSAEEEKAWNAERDQMVKTAFGPLIDMAQVSPPLDNKHT